MSTDFYFTLQMVTTVPILEWSYVQMTATVLKSIWLHLNPKKSSSLIVMKRTEVQTLSELRLRDSLPLLGWAISMSLLAVSRW